MTESTSVPGKTTIALDVLTTIARLTTLSVDGVSRRLFHKGLKDGVRIEVEDDYVYADLYVVLIDDINIRDVSRNIQMKVARAISDMVGMQVGQVNIHIEDIDYPGEPEA
jgi:uncharacterized alkaline shock family protein YloU